MAYDGPARRVALERREHLDPDGRAVLAQVTPLQPEGGRLAPRKARRVKLDEGWHVVRMDDVLEGLLEQFLAGVADDGAIRPVDAEEAAGGVVVDDADGGVLERAAEPLLALAQRRFRPLPIGDVPRQGHREAAATFPESLAPDLHRENRPVTAAVPGLERHRLPVVELALQLFQTVGA